MESKKVLVVGASGGIGNKVAEMLLDADYSVIGTYYQHSEKIDNLKKYSAFSNYKLDMQEPSSIIVKEFVLLKMEI